MWEEEGDKEEDREEGKEKLYDSYECEGPTKRKFFHSKFRSSDQCGCKAYKTEYLKKHRKMVHKKSTYSCALRGDEANMTEDLKKHREEIHQNLVYSCFQCGFEANKIEDIKKHREEEHKAPVYLCSQCGFKANSTEDLKHHKETQHLADSWEQYPPVEGSLPQPVGSTSGQSVRSLISADSALSAPQPGSPEDQVYSCDQCGNKASRTEDVKMHKENVQTNSVNPCDQCGCKAYKTEYLKKHRKMVHKKSTYSCALRGDEANMTEDLKKHREEIHQNLVYSCFQCGFEANKIEDIKKHREEEHKAPVYLCSQCGFKANSTEDLKHHKETQHLADSWEQYPPVEGSLPQPVGSTSGQSVRSLISADSALSAPQPGSPEDQVYSCDQCGNKASRTEDVKMHKENVQTISVNPCDQCGCEANKTGELKKHKDLKRKDLKKHKVVQHKAASAYRRTQVIAQCDGADTGSETEDGADYEESDSDMDWEDPVDPSDDEAAVELDCNNSIRSLAEDEALNDEEYNEDERQPEDENDDEVQQIQVQTSNRMPIQREQRNRVLTKVNIMNSRTEESSSLPIVAVTNFRSLSPKINNVKTDIIEREIGITLCSETWQKDSNKKLKTDIERLLELDGLQFISCPRPSTKRGGGCAVIVNTNKFTVEKLSVLVPHKLEVVWCLVRPRELDKTTRFKEIIACAFY